MQGIAISRGSLSNVGLCEAEAPECHAALPVPSAFPPAHGSLQARELGLNAAPNTTKTQTAPGHINPRTQHTLYS